MHTSERGDWTQNRSDLRKHYYQQPDADEPLGISGQKTWSQAVTSSDPRNYLYNHHQPGTSQPMKIVPGKREWSQIVANPRRYNQQAVQVYQTSRGNQSKQPMGVLGRQKWASQQGSSIPGRFNELGTGQYHISTPRQRPKIHKPFHYGTQNKLGSMQLMGNNPLPSGTRGVGRARRNIGSKKPPKVSTNSSILCIYFYLSFALCNEQPNSLPPFAGIQVHTIGGQHR